MTKLINTPFADSGDKATIPQTDAAGNVNWTQGFPADYSKNPDTDPSAKRIERDDFNGLLNYITSAIRELQVNGVAPYIEAADNGGSAFAYGKGAIVIYGGVVYQSLKTGNVSLPTVLADWAPVPNLNMATTLPVGVPIPWPTATPPEGFITMSGQTITATQYPRLFALYGSKLPDLRGEFIRGWDNARGIDVNRVLLSAQGASGLRQFTGNNDVQYNGLGITEMTNAEAIVDYDSGWAVARNAGQTTNSSGANINYVRPRNIAFNYIVRGA